MIYRPNEDERLFDAAMDEERERRKSARIEEINYELECVRDSTSLSYDEKEKRLRQLYYELDNVDYDSLFGLL